MPTISGTARVGQTLTATRGSWSGTTPILFAYQWLRCDSAGCTAVTGATSPTYGLITADVGKAMRVLLTGSNAYGSAAATSAPTATVVDEAPPPPPPPAPPPPPPPSTTPDTGVAFHCGWSDYTDAQRATVLDKLQAAGVKWVRIDVGWSSLQEVGRNQLSQWYVDTIDRCVDMARARGINVLAILFRTPSWANGGQGVQVPPLDNADFAWIAHWAADHFRGRVSAWEMWNEPDPAQSSWSWSGTALQYVSLLRAGYPAIKAGDPNATVVFGGPSSNDESFIAACYAAGAHGYFDVMATHPYQAISDTPPESAPDSRNWWFARLGAVRDLMVQNGDGNKPIWFTEFGWSSHDNWQGVQNWQRGVTLAQQGDYLVRAIEYAKAQYPYVTNMFWYDERNQTGTDIQNANFGLLTNNLTEKPVYWTLKTYLTG
ncbi:MAG TPA: cellulase family glycosylhydrolase [Gaiellaceae bacterium]|nr:cellulase family glycosylhydrolase [Gaiellaceae bacterium]